MGVRSSSATVAAAAAAAVATATAAAADTVAATAAATEAVVTAAAAAADTVASAAAAAEAVATTSSSWDAVSRGAGSVNSPQERSMPLRWLSSTHLPHWPKLLLAMPPMEAGLWSERSVSGISTLAATAVGRTVGHALGWIACVATSLNAAFVNGRPARPIK